MKPIACFIFMLFLLYSKSVFAQSQLKLRIPYADGHRQSLFSLHTSDTTLFDSAIRVVQVYKDDKQVISYLLKARYDSSLFSYSILDSLIYDSALFEQIILNDTAEGYKLALIHSDDIHAEYPIEDVKQIFANPKMDTTVVATITNDSNKVKKKSPVTIHGSITTIGQLSDNKYSDQTIPQNYIRTYVNTDVEVGGVPFSTGYYYSTESNSGLNKINNFRFSFQYEKFYQNIKNRMTEKIKTDRNVNLDQLSEFDIKQVNKEYSKIHHHISTPEFNKQIRKNKAILELGEKDTSFKRTYRYKKAFQQQKDYQLKLDRLQEIEKLKDLYEKNSRIADWNAGMKEVNMSTPGGFKKRAMKYEIVKPGQSLLLSLKKLDLGTFDPNYNTLVLNGVNLTGINVEVNPGDLYGAFTWGAAIANFDNPLAVSSLAGSRSIMAGRIGVGRTEKLLVAMTVLKGSDGSGNTVKDSNYAYYLPKHNYVVGVDLNYKISPDAEVGVEYAKSQNEEIAKESNSAPEQIGSLLNPKSATYSSAWSGYARVNFNDHNSRIKVSARHIDPFYYSFGTPYLRRDNFRIEVKGEQLFWRKQLTTGITYRRDADNLYELKQGTSINNTVIFNAQLRIKKYPYVLLTYSPNYQSFYNAALRKQIHSAVKLYSAVVGYTYQTKKVVATSTINYSKQYNESNQSEWASFGVNQYAVYENVLLRKYNLSFKSAINYILPINDTDTGKVFSASCEISKGLFGNRLTVNGGYRYQKDFAIEQRHIVECGTDFQLGWGISCQLHLERHFIKTYQASGTPSDMVLGRITLIKTF